MHEHHDDRSASMIDPDDPRSKMAPTTSDPGHPQPDTAEVESARLLANETKDRLVAEGIPEDEVRRLADEFVALDLASASNDEFVAWVVGRRR
jgi:hypothetical protein